MALDSLNNKTGDQSTQATADHRDGREHDDADKAFPEREHGAQRASQHRNPGKQEPTQALCDSRLSITNTVMNPTANGTSSRKEIDITGVQRSRSD
jgi:hypothetical protein